MRPLTDCKNANIVPCRAGPSHTAAFRRISSIAKKQKAAGMTPPPDEFLGNLSVLPSYQ
jgi:hypothetical protein